MEVVSSLVVMNVFGVRPQDKEAIVFEPIFLLMYYMGFAFRDFGLGPLTTSQRRWFVHRLNEEIERAKKAEVDIPTKAPIHNDPGTRELTGKFKQFTPNARIQRFS